MKQVMFDFSATSVPSSSRQGMESDIFNAQHQMSQRKANTQLFFIKYIPNPKLFKIVIRGQISFRNIYNTHI